MTTIILISGGLLCIAGMIFLHRGFPGSIKQIGYRMTGVWVNPHRDLHVLLHVKETLLRGHAVSRSGNRDDQGIVGSLVIKGMEVKPFWRWSAGTFVEPGTRQELPLRVRLKNRNTLSVYFLSEKRREEWRLIDPLN